MTPDRISRKAVCTGINSDESCPIISKNSPQSEVFLRCHRLGSEAKSPPDLGAPVGTGLQSRLEKQGLFIIEVSHQMPVTLHYEVEPLQGRFGSACHHRDPSTVGSR